MKNIVKACLFAAVILASSCVKEQHAVNLTVTYYPEFTLDGGSVYPFQVGSEFVEPGFTATLNGEDVTADVEVYGEVDGTVSGIYNLVYSYTNADGFEGTASRMVVVYDIANAGTANIAGTYGTSNTTTYRVPSGDLVRNWNVYGGFEYPMTVTAGPATGLFYMEDLYSGYYSKYNGYGSGYAFKPLILLNADNSIDILNGDDIDPWGDPVINHPEYDSYYDPANETIVVNWLWGYYGAGMVFRATYTK